MRTCKEIIAMIQKSVFDRSKIPHSFSDPVIYKENGKYYLAFFIFFFTREDIEAGAVDRPEMWLLADIGTGEIVERRNSRDNDFSDAPYNVKYNVRTEILSDTSAAYYDRAYSMLDRVREELADRGEPELSLYHLYLDKILANVPSAYRRFYTDLSVGFDKNNFKKEVTSMEEKEMLQEENIGSPPAAESVSGSAEPESGDPGLADRLSDVIGRLEKLQECFDAKIAEDEHKNKLFDNMHSELVTFQNGAYDKLIDTMALDIIQIIDSVKHNCKLYEKKEFSEENYTKLLRCLKAVAEDLNDVLYRHNIEPYEAVSREVDVRRQKIIQTIPTADETEDNKIAFRTACGYEKSGKVLRPERIKIYKYDPNAQTKN